MRTDIGKSQQCVTERGDTLSWLKTELQGPFEEQFCRRIPFFVALSIGNKSPQELKPLSNLFVSVVFSPHFLFATEEEKGWEIKQNRSNLCLLCLQIA